MITLDTFKDVLDKLGFTNEHDMYTRHFDTVDCDLKADFRNKRLIYPTEKGFQVNDGTTSNFAHPENFVVFECVARLLEKGYRPEHIELEPRWTLGHGGKSGKADICVRNKDGSPYLCIIECKTAESEYKKELSNMRQNGGQLFSYWQQSKATKWLVLYASDFDEETQRLTSTIATVSCSDDANLVELAKDDSSLKLYRDAATVEGLFQVWKETYEQKFYGDILFDEETVAYDIGVLPLKKKRLVDFSRDDKIVNQFEEILRHNNVSDKENAFNRLIALFIAKLHDEKTKTLESEVEFQYKTGTDTYQKMQDRLQKLHHCGMREFMKEEVFYVPDDYVKNLMKNSIGENREQLEAELNETITKLKFYTNNDFAFKDVHNKALFYQNGKILVEMVELFQRYRIIDSNDLQLLGDMFEQLLNKGFKQNEGQFFTPIPITCFIWKCLPLESIIVHADTKEIRYPKVIDYACGAGHFLTEGFREINEVVGQAGLAPEKGWERDCIFGIEKDYRLARVSKISLFMHGADNGNIVFGDGLDNHVEKIVIQNGQFDILVANPPYSVSAFKNHLELKNNQLELLQYISKDGKEIETLFVERIAQLLRPRGIAAVILPSSILSNSSTSYIKAREELLKHFDIRAIVQFGSKTFGATGTNTVVLFLQKNGEPPVKAKIVKDTVAAILERDDLQVAGDREILDSYCRKLKLPKEEYLSFIQAARQSADYTQHRCHPYFGMYVREFEEGADFRKTKAERRSRAFYEYSVQIEREKLYYFALVHKQHTLVVTAPSDNSQQEAFLGYSWSNRKGDEGIKIKGGSPQNACGLLYNAYDEEGSIARSVKDAFLGIYRSGTYTAAGPLQDMIDFSRASFDKAIRTNVENENGKVKIESRWPLVKLGEIAPYETERVPYKDITAESYISTDNLLQNCEGITSYEGVPHIEAVVRYQKYDILVSNIRPYLKKAWLADRDGGCSPDVLVFRIADTSSVLPQFLYCMITQDAFFEFMMAGKKGVKMPRGDKNVIPSFQIPLPPLEVQKSIVAECEAVDAGYQDAQKEIEKCKNEIADIMENVQGEKKRLGDICDSPVYGANVAAKEGNPQNDYRYIRITDIDDDGNLNSDWKTAEKIEDKYILKEGDVLFARSGATAGKTFLYTDNVGKAIYAGYLIKFTPNKTILLPKYLIAFTHSRFYLQWAESTRGGTAQPNINAQQYSSLQIPVPPLAEQQRIVAEISALEERIAQAKTLMAACPEKKRRILDRWLK